MKIEKDLIAVENRLKLILAHYGTVQNVAVALKTSKKNIYRWMSGESVPTLGNVTRIEMLALQISAQKE